MTNMIAPPRCWSASDEKPPGGSPRCEYSGRGASANKAPSSVMCIDVNRSPATPAPPRNRRRSTSPPIAAIQRRRPAAMKVVCSRLSAQFCCRAAWCSAGVCQAHTTTSSIMEAGIGANILGHAAAGSNRVPDDASAKSGAATATNAMWTAICAENDCLARAGPGPSHAAARTSTASSRNITRMISRKGTPFAISDSFRRTAPQAPRRSSRRR